MGRIPQCASDRDAIASGTAHPGHDEDTDVDVASHRVELNGPVTTGSSLKVCMETGPGRANVVVERDTVLVVSAALEGT